MKKKLTDKLLLNISVSSKTIAKANSFVDRWGLQIVIMILSLISVITFFHYYLNGLGLSYNDARSHLDIGRRVVEGLKPGIAQLGSVWLPLNHVLMVPLIWNDWMWHSGFAGAVWNMISFVGTGVIIYKFLEKLKVGFLGRIFGITVFVANLNILYLQSTAMTEPLLLFTMTASCYYLMLWAYDDELLDLVKASVWLMLATLVRYDGWFLLGFATLIVGFLVFRKNGYKPAEGTTVLFLTMAAFGIVMWFLWNLVIFKDPLFFILGPFSAHAQQTQLAEAGDLPTKYNLLLSIKMYFYSVIYNSVATTAIVGMIAGVVLLFDKKLPFSARFSTVALMSPLFFNIIALFMGFSVIFIQGISGNTWFNVRYGVMLMPTLAIYLGYLVNRLKDFRWVIIGIFAFTTFFAFANTDSVAIDDARVGSSQKNVSEVSGYLERNTKDNPGFILISAASHDAIIFSSKLPMKKFIHEGTGLYWESAVSAPDRWARWIVMRTYDDFDLVYKNIKDKPGFINHYVLVESYPFADIYELKYEYLERLNTQPVFQNQK